MMNDGWEMGWGMPFWGLFFWLLIVVGIIFLVRWIIGHKEAEVQTEPLNILKQRYARGEIDRQTYERMKKGSGIMKSNRRLLRIAITFLTIGAVGQFAMHSSMAQKNHMSMMGGMMMNGMMGKRIPQGINPDQLPAAGSIGARLLGRYCSQCHGLPGPGLHTASEWPTVVARMNRRMQMMSRKRMMMNIEAPNKDELEILIAYLEKNAQQTIDLKKLSGADTAEGQAFQKTCSQCHALPDPAQHTHDEWPAVIKRMRKNMISMGKSLPDQATIDQISVFLQRYSAKQTSGER